MIKKVRKFLRAIYNYIPFRYELYKYLRNFNLPFYQHLHFKGLIDVDVENHSSFKMYNNEYAVENEIFWKGIYNGWEKVSIRLWGKLCEDSSVIFDIGANTGVYALLAKTINKNASVYAFEPVTRVYDVLVKNCEENNYDIHNYKLGISNFDGEAIIYDFDSPHVYTVSLNKDINDTGTNYIETKIDVIRLDTFIKQNNISHIDLMKIDVETYEPEVIEGFGQYLQKFQPTLLIEILNDEIGEKIEKLVNGIDYLFFNIDEKGGIKKVETIKKSDYYNYLLCKKEVAKKLDLI